MAWRVELTLRPGRAVLEQHTTLYNRSPTRHRFYWWTNAGVEVWDDSRILYPMRFTAAHGFADVDTWPVNAKGVDLSVVGNHRDGPVSRFSHGSREAYMAVYHPRTRAGVVHYSSPLDLPSKKIWSWGSDAAGLDWRRALSDNQSAYVEIQAGLFRNQETYAFLDPQDSVRFSEFWMPIRDLDGLSRANVDAALHLTRPPSAGDDTRLAVALNVTRPLAEARVSLQPEHGGGGVTETVMLDPAVTWRHEFAWPWPGENAVFTLSDRTGRIVLRHTEGTYDYAPNDEIAVGPQPVHAFPAPERRSEDDFAALGESQELDGRLLDALGTYRAGLARFHDSLALARAAGRLEVGLKQFAQAGAQLGTVLSRVSNDQEAAYYDGLVASALGDTRRARVRWELAQQFGPLRQAALFALAGLDAREGDRAAALDALEAVTAAAPDAERAGLLEVALLRSLGRANEALARLLRWRRLDPTSSFLRVEAAALEPDHDHDALWRHLAADPERILEVAVDYMHVGLWQDAEAVLARDYPRGPGVVGEPGAPHPSEYPLLGYYRGYCRQQLGQDGRAAFEAASRLPTTYVFPNRPETFPVLAAALRANPGDATAHFLLGSLYLSGGMVDEALREWETTRTINPDMPTLHRNMGYAVLRSGGRVERAIELFREGTAHDPQNVGLYFGLDEALTTAGRPPGDRADALLAFPDRASLPAALVYRLAVALADAGRFDEADAQFPDRFFPREEGGVNVRQVYLEVRLKRARALAADGDCTGARAVLASLRTPVSALEFTRDGLEPFLARSPLRELVDEVTGTCREHP
jgi:tetratricopeptide (TPR) repeat protein